MDSVIPKGLSAKALRQLYRACIISIADYGSPIWSNGSTEQAKPLQAIQNAVLRVVTSKEGLPKPRLMSEAGKSWTNQEASTVITMITGSPAK
ncbi:hypothetical protein M433DRAFT_9176 [Acidomyces richmondensis BFW]|nr:hypothetical protein M433DRAFT_9176 [Acidomyces richmondensis BFW]